MTPLDLLTFGLTGLAVIGLIRLVVRFVSNDERTRKREWARRMRRERRASRDMLKAYDLSRDRRTAAAQEPADQVVIRHRQSWRG